MWFVRWQVCPRRLHSASPIGRTYSERQSNRNRYRSDREVECRRLGARHSSGCGFRRHPHDGLDERRRALKHTIETGKAAFYSRSRKKFWIKGESSGHTQDVVEILTDCDQDTLVVKVKSHGPACHAGYQSCFYRKVDLAQPNKLVFTADRVFDPDQVYG